MSELTQAEVEELGFRKFSIPSAFNCDAFWQRPAKDDRGTRYYINMMYWDNRVFPGGRASWQMKARLYKCLSDLVYIEVTFCNVKNRRDAEDNMVKLEHFYRELGCEHEQLGGAPQ
jgi:hypothetical protein